MSKSIKLYDARGAELALAAPRARRETRNFDAWRNPATGFGTSRDKTEFTRYFGPDWLSDAELSNLFHGNAIAARMVCARPDETMREGFSADTGDEGLNEALLEHSEELGVLENFSRGMWWGRLFGGGAVLIGCDDGRSAAKPLQPERANDLSYLRVFDKRYLYPNTWYEEPGHPKLGRPETYYVTNPSMHAGGEALAIVHETRLITFGGAPTAMLEREINNGWDRSILQGAYEALRSFGVTFKSLEVLLTDGYQAVFKMSGLREALASEDDGGYLQRRMEGLEMGRSTVRAMMVDAGTGAEGEGEESFERNNVTLAGVPDSLDKICIYLAAHVRTPVTILLGQSPAGMNATGESDFRWWYDDIRSDQTLRLAPKLRRLYRVMLSTKRYGRRDQAVKITFPSLWSQSPKEAAETRKTVLDGDTVAVTSQIWLPEKVALVRSQPGGMQKEITFDAKERKAYEDALKSEQDLLVEEAGEPEPPPAPPGGGFGAPKPNGAPKAAPAPPPAAAE
jgi:uncharacterized protein